MKFFPLKIAILCLILTPILYIPTLNLSQRYLDSHYLQIFQNLIVGDSRNLLNGTVQIEQQIAHNIHAYLKQDFMVQHIGLNMDILVTTGQGKIIYPLYVDPETLTQEIGKNFDTAVIASKNFEILNKGLEVKVQTELTHGSNFANIILVFYSSLSLALFFIFYKIGSSRAARVHQAEKALIFDLKKEEQHHLKVLEELKEERRELFENIQQLNTKYQADKEKAKINEEEMFDEIISLEEQLNAFIDLKKRRESEIDELKSTLETYERRKGSATRRNEYAFLSKLFSVLYKNILVHRKALSGLLNLTEEQQIKAEELIHQLNENPDHVIIKRKVFSGKKHKTACFETLFAYNGRLYFTKQENKVAVLVIGTKNTQTKDMEFLHSL